MTINKASNESVEYDVSGGARIIDILIECFILEVQVHTSVLATGVQCFIILFFQGGQFCYPGLYKCTLYIKMMYVSLYHINQNYIDL